MLLAGSRQSSKEMSDMDRKTKSYRSGRAAGINKVSPKQFRDPDWQNDFPQ